MNVSPALRTLTGPSAMAAYWSAALGRLEQGQFWRHTFKTSHGTIARPHFKAKHPNIKPTTKASPGENLNIGSWGRVTTGCHSPLNCICGTECKIRRCRPPPPPAFVAKGLMEIRKRHVGAQEHCGLGTEVSSSGTWEGNGFPWGNGEFDL